MTINLSQIYDLYIEPLSIEFNKRTQGLDFFLFCSVYALIFLTIAYLTYRQKPGWIAPVKDLLTWREQIVAKLLIFLRTAPLISWFAKRRIKQEEDKIFKSFSQSFRKMEDPRKSTGLPELGMTEENLRKRIEQWVGKQKMLWNTNKISGSMYIQDDNYFKQQSEFSKNYLYQNPLHLDTYKQLIKMQSQVLQMTGSLLSKQKVYGTLTSGGTQSLILAIYAYKKYYNKQRPNIIVPVTAHVAIEKACFYFNVQCRKAKLNSKYQVDVKHLKSMIDKNTIMILGSAPNYPHGIVDPISQLGQLALKYNIGLHVDACLGGFVIAFSKSFKYDIPFNFNVNGVTSISIDHHKYGLSPKGCSGLFFKTKQLRQSQYYSYVDWCGGLYATPTLSGSRSGVATSGAWYAMTNITFQGYKNNAILIMETISNIVSQLRKIQQVQVYGNPCISVFSFTTKTINIYCIDQFLKTKKKWSCSTLQRPAGIHVTVTLANCQKLRNDFIRDLKQAISAVKLNPNEYKGKSVALYGVAQKIPDVSMKDMLVRVSVQAYLQS